VRNYNISSTLVIIKDIKSRQQEPLICQPMFITGPPTHSVGTRLVTVAGVCRRRRLLSSSVVCKTRICNVTHQGAARGGPVVLRPVRATPCFTSHCYLLYPMIFFVSTRNVILLYVSFFHIFVLLFHSHSQKS